MHEFKMAGCAVNDTKAEESQVHNLTQSSTVKILSRDVVCASKTLSASQNMPPFDLNREAAIDEIAEEREFQSPDCGAKKWMRHSNATMTMNARVSRSDEEAIQMSSIVRTAEQGKRRLPHPDLDFKSQDNSSITLEPTV